MSWASWKSNHRGENFMSLPAEIKTRLAAHAAAKRGRLLKDLGEADLMIGCDWLEEFHPASLQPPKDDLDWVYLKYASVSQLTILASRLVNMGVWLYIPRMRRYRPVRAFPIRAICNLFTFLGVKDSYRYWSQFPLGIDNLRQVLPDATLHRNRRYP
jgi:hypothetical protein